MIPFLRLKADSAPTSHRPTPTAGSPSTFRPFSADALSARLSTFTLPSFSASAFPAREAAEKGWENKGRERLICRECKAAWVVSDLKGLKPPTGQSAPFTLLLSSLGDPIGC